MKQLPLDREEYIEQAYFFRNYRERLEDDIPSQVILATIYEEILATTKLPMAIDFLKAEILLTGRISDGMEKLSHYFTPFQTFILKNAEDDKSKFDQKMGLKILEREAEYRSETPTSAGLFIYQFECIARNRLGYHNGLDVISKDTLYNDDWSAWIRKLKIQLGSVDFADLLYFRSQHFVDEQQRIPGKEDFTPQYPILFSAQDGRIAKANHDRDPLYMFAALQRQLGYPDVPRSIAKPDQSLFHPALEARLHKIETRLQLMDAELKGNFDLDQFIVKDPDFNEKDLE
ncbi:MAG: hypothetical protein K0U86_06050 [Planctomycetes bacterium]|nr:hypothetical protein [Planctomycetota bacterium]MCH9724449.1 hypothetical protein [Planctomycetota bacterium]MCH9778191.1 hypothetical protein [Planctomycetota bacterium]MCH9793398.1 hypothetical protein [Planctomycetota bacterium]